MLQVTEVAFTCYAVTDLPRARAFYEGVLGLKPNSMTSPQWVEYELGPHTISIGSAPGFNPNPDGCCAALEVDNFDEAIAHLRANQVKFRMEPFASPVCRMAMVFDPDGNTVCIHKRNAA
jgi:predicted enzyme related to lactoylglutathione lyase